MFSIQPSAQPRWQAWAKVVILFGLAVYFVVIILTGSLTNYINERFAWLTYAAVPMLLLLGLVSLREALKKPHSLVTSTSPPNPLSQREGESQSPTPLLGRGEGGEVPVRRGLGGEVLKNGVLVLAIPLLLGVLVPSRPLGASAISGEVSLSAVNTSNAAIFEADPLKWNVLDWLRAFHGSPDISTFNGKQANLVAFVYREASYPDNTFLAARFTLSCCVADASAIGLPVVWDEAANIRQDTWVRVSGTFQVGDFGADSVPMLIADTIEEVPQPEHPYLYP